MPNYAGRLMFKTFGNKVKIKSSADTEKINISGKTGEIFGQTVPSISGVDVIGSPKKDYAINVYFEDLDNSYRIDEDLIETLDINAGLDIVFGDKKFIKNNSGDWLPDADTSDNNNEQDSKIKNDLIIKLLKSEIRKTPLNDKSPPCPKNLVPKNVKRPQAEAPPKKWWQFWRP